MHSTITIIVYCSRLVGFLLRRVLYFLIVIVYFQLVIIVIGRLIIITTIKFNKIHQECKLSMANVSGWALKSQYCVSDSPSQSFKTFLLFVSHYHRHSISYRIQLDIDFSIQSTSNLYAWQEPAFTVNSRLYQVIRPSPWKTTYAACPYVSIRELVSPDDDLFSMLCSLPNANTIYLSKYSIKYNCEPLLFLKS